jgi:NADH:ubiquinone oxidoreductase subunit 4 (subunit M)
MNRCTLVFLSGILISVGAYAFMQQFMQMPQQAMQMMIPQQQPRDCECKTK